MASAPHGGLGWILCDGYVTSAPHGGLGWILCDGYVTSAPHGGLGWMGIVSHVFIVYHLMSWVG